MEWNLQYSTPEEIERRSFSIISQEMGEVNLPAKELAVLQRVIHTTADFDYVDNLVFSQGAVEGALEAIRQGVTFITDTKMAYSGINRKALAQAGCHVECFIDDPQVAQTALERGTTRSATAMELLAERTGEWIVAIGNAPTALLRLCELIREGKISPKLVIGVPVGFVNVVESKLQLLDLPVSSIVAKGRKGGSNVAAAICNALLYQATGRSI